MVSADSNGFQVVDIGLTPPVVTLKYTVYYTYTFNHASKMPRN